MFEEIKNIKTSKKEIRSFGVTIGIILLLISGFLFYSNKESYQIVTIISCTFIILGSIIPILLKPVYLIWMAFAVILGWIMTRVILSIVFYFIMTPIGIITRIFGEDFLALKRDNVPSYWNERDSNIELSQDYKKQF